jgi:hypothetical protein
MKQANRQVARLQATEEERLRVLVDTNVWRYLVNQDPVEIVYKAAKVSHGVILACPAVLYEMLRLEDAALRRALVKAICRSR